MLNKEKKVILITGSNGLLGQSLVKFLSINNTVITLGRKNCDIYYHLGARIADIIPENINVTYLFHLAYDHSNTYVEGRNINIYAAKNIAEYCKNRKIKLIYISSFAALSEKSEYGKNKRSCELIFEKLEDLVKIIRLGMLYEEKLGLIYKINCLIRGLKFCPLPGDGKFIVYLANLTKVTSYLNSFEFPKSMYIYLAELPALYFSDLVNPYKKSEIRIPLSLIKFFLYIPHSIGFRLKSISYDGFLGLINPPELPRGVILYEHL